MCKRTVLLLMFLAMCCLVNSQQVMFTLFEKRMLCPEKVTKAELYSIRKGDFYHTVWGEDEYPLILPDTGIYIIGDIYGRENFKIHVDNFGTFNDTTVVESIWIDAYLHKFHDVYWLCCGVRCKGCQADYYSNGNIRLEGFFRKGRPKGGVKFYRPDGTLESIKFYRGKYNKGKALKHVIHFDENGNVIRSHYHLP